MKKLSILITLLSLTYYFFSPENISRKLASKNKINSGSRNKVSFIGKIIKFKGQAKIFRNNKKIQLNDNNFKLKRLDKIVTEERSFVKIKLKDGSVFLLSSNSSIVLKEFKINSPSDRNLIINLLSGLLRSKFTNKINKGYLLIKTKTAAMGVRGTEFITYYDPSTKVTTSALFEGEIIVDNYSNKLKILKPNQLIHINKHRQEVSDFSGNFQLENLASEINYTDTLKITPNKQINIQPLLKSNLIDSKRIKDNFKESIFEKKKSVFLKENEKNAFNQKKRSPSSINSESGKDINQNDDLNPVAKELYKKKLLKDTIENNKKEILNKIESEDKNPPDNKSIQLRKEVLKRLNNDKLDYYKKNEYIDNLFNKKIINVEEYEKLQNIVDFDQEVSKEKIASIINNEDNFSVSENTEQRINLVQNNETEKAIIQRISSIKENYINREEKLTKQLYYNNKEYAFVLQDSFGNIISKTAGQVLSPEKTLTLNEDGSITGIKPMRDSTGQVILNEETGLPINIYLDENLQLSSIPILTETGDVKYINAINESGEIIFVPTNREGRFINISSEVNFDYNETNRAIAGESDPIIEESPRSDQTETKDGTDSGLLGDIVETVTDPLLK